MKPRGESSALRPLAQALLKAVSPELVIATSAKAGERLSLQSNCCRQQLRAPQNHHH